MSAAVTASNAANGVSSSSSAAASSSAVAAAGKPAVQPSEVGWLFVTQYYTFLNQNPGRLHCFFTKKSTMVHGTEQEESSPCFGQQQIHDKITSLNFQDAKVFVSNVDTQSSASGGILVQVLGELSNNGGAWRKFAQTFFLAEQPNGYYVLNDIFRYLKDEEEIEAEAEALDEAIQDEIDEADKKGVEVPHTIEVNNIGNSNALPHLPLPSSTAAPSKAIESTEAQLAETASAQVGAAPAVDEAVATSTDAEPTKAEADQVGIDKKVTAVEAEEAPAATKGASDAAAAAKTETAPAATASAPAAPAAAPAQPAGKPKTWATLAASDVTRWGSNVSAEAKGVSSSRPAAAATKPATPAAAGSASSSPSVYIKNVDADKVTDAALRQALEAFGTVKDVQILANRSCAFAEFTSVDGARKAVAKGSVAVSKNGVSVTIEERRKPAAGAGGRGAGAGGAQRNGAGAGNGRAAGGAARGGAAVRGNGARRGGAN
ncbi:related to Ras-GTPase-activating protein binding protein 2 [Sporisorium scitamineum]|uniref:Related to Ras-GTPase-activating protein binding protein 2 n=1 Tax=Sporisorium scitamineum TaxID=49012 RepID=A0A127Z4C5_9BASI|nr:related to Ras-GTPase-activating protein binding protein 2 [Sporisorium scitamineum]